MLTEISPVCTAACTLAAWRTRRSERQADVDPEGNSRGKAIQIARAACGMLGGNGISGEYGVARCLVNLAVVNPCEGNPRHSRAHRQAGYHRHKCAGELGSRSGQVRAGGTSGRSPSWRWLPGYE